MNRRALGASALLLTLIVLSNSFVSAVVAAPTESARPMLRKLDLVERTKASDLWVPGELVVGFERSVSRSAAARSIGATGARIKDHLPELDASVVKLPPGLSVSEAARSLDSKPGVAFAEPNKIIRLAGIPPNDARFDDLWGLHNTGQPHRVTDPPPTTASGTPDADGDVLEAWDQQTGNAETVIAVVDSGVDVDHSDLDGSLWVNPGEIPDNNQDDDDNGFIDDVHGWDVAQDDESLLQSDETIGGRDHGTHVAGTIAAERNNGVGVAGVCPGCKIMVLKFMKPRDTDGDHDPDEMVGTLGAELEALNYARKEGADIVNASFSTFLWSRTERDAFRKLGRNGILTVAAAGNSSLDNDLALNYQFPDGSLGFSPEYPASFTIPEIISVAASNHKDEYGYFTGCDTDLPRWKCEFTSWGHDSVDFAAPGVDIVSTVPGNAYRAFNGTSMATPFTAGTAGLVSSSHPNWGAVAIKNAIMNSVDKPASLKKMPAFKGGAAEGKFTRTSGRVNAHDALDASTANATPKTDGNINGARSMRKFKSGMVSWPADTNDVYKRRFEKGKEYKVVLNGPGNKDFDLVAWKPGTKEIWQLENGCFIGDSGNCKLLRYKQRQDSNAADEQFRFTAKQTGNYYIQVSAFLFNKGDYTVRIKRI